MVEQVVIEGIPSHLSDNSRVWVYQANRALTTAERASINQYVEQFTTQWVSHSKQLLAFGAVFFERFVVLMVDGEQGSDASGCSIDASVRFMQELGKAFNIDWFNRFDFAYLKEGKVLVVNKEELPQLYASKEIDSETLFFDHLVQSKEALTTQWLKPLKDSWHRRFL